MKWKEARELFPNQLLLVSILDFHYVGNMTIVDNVAPIRPIKDEDATKEFFNAKEGTMVYHTENEDFVNHIRRDPLMKRKKHLNPTTGDGEKVSKHNGYFLFSMDISR